MEGWGTQLPPSVPLDAGVLGGMLHPEPVSYLFQGIRDHILLHTTRELPASVSQQAQAIIWTVAI